MNIEDLLRQIIHAPRGLDVRQSIHDAIKQCYFDGKAGAFDLEARELIKNLISLVGTPLTATSESDMNDTSKIYVYVGPTDQSFINGNWYFYNNSEWVSGGIYNSTAFNPDKTLKIQGAAADSKTVGDNFDNIETVIRDSVATEILLADRCFRPSMIVCADSSSSDFGSTKGDDSGYSITEFIDIRDFDYLDIVVTKTDASYTFAGIVFYDDALSPIAGFTFPNDERNNEIKRFKIDNTYKYVRTTFRNGSSYIPFSAFGYTKTGKSNIKKRIEPEGILDAYIDGDGNIVSSNLTKTFYSKSVKDGVYDLLVYSTRNLLSVAEFESVPEIGSSSNNYFSAIPPNNTLRLNSRFKNSYIAWSFVENTSPDVIYLNLLLREYISNIGRTVEDHMILPDEYCPDINKNTRKNQGYIIDESGHIVENQYGYYLGDIDVEEGTQYYIDVFSTNTNLTNTRVHGFYKEGLFLTWVEQILLLEKNGSTHASGSFIIPEGVNCIRISSSKTETIQLKQKYYIDLSIIDLLKRFDVSNKNVNMGNPYIYLSDEIPDEIIDYTTVNDVYSIYDSLVSSYPKFIKRLDNIGYDESGLPIRLYRVSWQNPWLVENEHEASWSDEDNVYNSDYINPKLFVNAGTHGNEKSSVFGVALAIKELVESNDPWALYLKGNFVIDICPVANPWGYNNTSRNGYGHVNINRDFLSRTRSESRAIYNLLSNGNYYAAIDSHNSGGNANYFGITKSNPLIKTYVQMNMKLAGIVYDSWKNAFQDDQYSVDPYMMCWVSEPIGMLQDMFCELNIPGYLIESVGVYKTGMGTLTPNHKKYCKFTKDLLINSLIALGTTNWNDVK